MDARLWPQRRSTVNPLGLRNAAMPTAEQPKVNQQRQDRLAAALRDNLKRRKARAREGDLAKPDPKDDD